MMVKAGAPVDATIAELKNHLEPGDVLIDGGNEFFQLTERRTKEIEAAGLRYIGMGVSGGEEGARHGPSLMPGGTRDGYHAIEDVVTKIAAQVKDGPCVTYIGPGGAGHFVKMVHNGIEYGDMQLIAETYDVLKSIGGLGNAELGDTFAKWNGAELESFLIEITAAIFKKRDPDTGKDLVDVILDSASMKGTGKWTVQQGAELAAPLLTIASAVDSRVLSAMRSTRLDGSKVLSGPSPAALAKGDRAQLIDDARHALYAAKVVSYAQGMAMLRLASDAYKWDLALSELARIWKGGCIIRAALLGRIQEAFSSERAPLNLLFTPAFAEDLSRRQDGWRRTVSRAIGAGIAVPALSASLAYYDSIRRARTPANLIQAQRDFFGAHTYERLDKPGTFHTEWP
jgi:6-phosphogluconate dehydrogenase